MAPAQSGDVQVYRSLEGLQAASGANALRFPVSATVLPATPFAGATDYSCIASPPGIDLPVGATAPLANVQAPNANAWICFIGPQWNGGLANINPTPESPTIVANGEDDYGIAFAAPVYAAGFRLLTNSTATEKITLNFVDGSKVAFDFSPGAADPFKTAPNAFQFAGFKSMKAIASVFIDTEGGTAQNEGITAIDAAYAIDIDIKPCSEPTPVNIKSEGAVTAAILGSTDFDVSLIDLSTATLQGLSPKEPGQSGKLLCRIEDVAGREGRCGPDGFPDLVCHFQMDESKPDLDNQIWSLRAETFSGVALLGFDSVKVIVPPSTGKDDDGQGKSGDKNTGTGNDKSQGQGKNDNVPPGQAKEKPGNNGNSNNEGNSNNNGNSNGKGNGSPNGGKNRP
jgi:hypothetical protein